MLLPSSGGVKGTRSLMVCAAVVAGVLLDGSRYSLRVVNIWTPFGNVVMSWYLFR